MEGGVSAKALSTELKTGLAFLTRLPLVPEAPATGADVARASWTFPVIGIGVGIAAALVYWIAHGLGLPALVSAVLAVAATLLITGCLHEDGLADTADGFGGGGTTPERKLEIMRDSRIGTYGVAALSVSLLLRVGAIASLAEPQLVALALIAAHAGARATLPVFMRRVPRARADGLSADAGVPPQQSSAIAVAIGVVATWLCLGFGAFIALLLLIAALVLMAWLSMVQIGGQTGDVLGAVEQVSEVLILLVAAARLV